MFPTSILVAGAIVALGLLDFLSGRATSLFAASFIAIVIVFAVNWRWIARNAVFTWLVFQRYRRPH